MTGFGHGRAAQGDDEITVELKSLNHKFCEVKARLPRELASLEPALTRAVKEKVARGSVELLVRRARTAGPEREPTVDLALAQAYRRAFEEVARALGLPLDLSAKDVALQPGVIQIQETVVDPQALQGAVAVALATALDALTRMRAAEGQALHADLSARLGTLATFAAEIEKLAPEAVADHRQRLSERVAELARVPLDPQRLSQEVAFFAERTDIAEELSRFQSHLEQFRALLASPEPAGRKMDFLVQEMHREVNTAGSKSQHPGISTRVVAMKAEIERIREQVQNVE